MTIMTTIPRDELDALHSRIRQLEDEVARLRAVNENARTERALRLLESAWHGARSSNTEPTERAEAIVDDILTLDQALAAQSEKEKANG